MRRIAYIGLLCAVVVASGTGCMSTALRRQTNQTIETLTDIQYQQVLNNIAMYVTDPSVVPNFAVVSTGVVQINDLGSGGYRFDSNPFGSQTGTNNNTISLSGSRTISGQWSLVPTTDPRKLERMKHAYQLLVGFHDPHEDGVGKLAEFFGDEFPKAIPVGWFHVGSKHDVPKEAVHTGRFRDIYVWVMPEGLPGLARFTLSVLDIATVESHVPTAQVTRIYNGPATDTPVRTEVVSQEPLPIAGEINPFKAREKYHRVDAPGLNFIPQ